MVHMLTLMNTVYHTTLSLFVGYRRFESLTANVVSNHKRVVLFDALSKELFSLWISKQSRQKLT